MVPVLLVIVASFSGTRELRVPPSVISLRWYGAALEREAFREALRVSAGLAAAAASLSVGAAVLAGIAIERWELPGGGVVVGTFMSPLTIPQVVLGLGFLLVAQHYIGTGLALVALHVALTFPFALRVVLAALARIPKSVEEAAMVLGAGPGKAYLYVVVPMIREALAAAWLLAFAVSFENFTATQFLSWERRTLPVELYMYMVTENDPVAAAVASCVVVAVVAGFLVLDRWVRLGDWMR
jgi:putative spermidine/putrescine transport system permease protein